MKELLIYVLILLGGSCLLALFTWHVGLAIWGSSYVPWGGWVGMAVGGIWGFYCSLYLGGKQ